MDIKFIEGKDHKLELKVYDDNGEEIPIDEYRRHNEKLRSNPEFETLLKEITKEYYEQILENHIEFLRKEIFIREGISESSSIYSNDNHSLEELREELEYYLNARKVLAEDIGKAQKEYTILQYEFGACHSIWAHIKKELKEKYGITWYTPAELHPYVMYD